MKEFFNEGLKKIGLELDGATVDMLLEYGNLLLETNKHTNLILYCCKTRSLVM
jgi:16S rRNA G527 N7-methylase RsmG